MNSKLDDMRIITKNEIIESFSQKVQKQWERKHHLPVMEQVEWDELEYLGWIHKSGHLGYMVSEYESSLVGLVLERSSSRPKKAMMCDICRKVQSGQKIATFSFWVSMDTQIGKHICVNLDCSKQIRNPGADDMRETLGINEKSARLHENMKHFIKQLEIL